MAGDGIPSEPARQVTAEDAAEREKREAEKNATKASLNISAGAGTPAQTPVPAAGKKQSIAPSVLFLHSHNHSLTLYPLSIQHKGVLQARKHFHLQHQRQALSSTARLRLIHLTLKTPKSLHLPLKARLSSLGISDSERYAVHASPMQDHALCKVVAGYLHDGQLAMFPDSAVCHIVHMIMHIATTACR